jgi:hypothetical protein
MCKNSAVQNKEFQFVVVLTQRDSFFGFATTHQNCLDTFEDIGGKFLAEYRIQKKFDDDGLIAASFFARDQGLTLATMICNDAANCLFPRS